MTILNIIHEEIFKLYYNEYRYFDSGLYTKHYANTNSLHFGLISQMPGVENTRYTCV